MIILIFFTTEDWLTTGENIVIKCEKRNFAHLIGAHYATKNGIFRMSSNEFYYRMKTKEDIQGLFDLIDEDDFNNNSLSREAFFIEGKNEYFIDLFDSFLKSNGQNIRLYKQPVGGQFDADFLHLLVLNPSINKKGYIGIVGSDNSDYYWFNSIYIDENTKRTLGVEFTIKCLKIIDDKDSKILDDIDFYLSRRNKNNKTTKKNINKEKQFKFDKKAVSKINKKLKPGYSLVKGNGKASQFNLVRNKSIIVENFQDEPFEKSLNGIVAHINHNY